MPSDTFIIFLFYNSATGAYVAKKAKKGRVIPWF